MHFLGGLNPVKPVLMLMELNGVSTFQLAKYKLDGVGRGVYPCLCRNFKGNWGRKHTYTHPSRMGGFWYPFNFSEGFWGSALRFWNTKKALFVIQVKVAQIWVNGDD